MTSLRVSSGMAIGLCFGVRGWDKGGKTAGLGLG